jgi:large subunit ribosomal protein L15
MRLNQVYRASRPLRSRKRVGRGHSAGQGKTAGRGQKGQKARYQIRPGFEGGQNPLFMRTPKLRGTSNKSHNIGLFRAEYSILNVEQLERLDAGTEVTLEAMRARGWVKKVGKKGLKVLGQGALTKALTVRAQAVSESARQKIEQAGGTVEVIGR